MSSMMLQCPACGGPLLDEELPIGPSRQCVACGASVHRELAVEDHGLSRFFEPRPPRVLRIDTRAALSEARSR